MNDKLKIFEFNMVGRYVDSVEVSATNSRQAFRFALKMMDRETIKGEYVDWDEEDITLTTVDGQDPYEYQNENDDHEFRSTY